MELCQVFRSQAWWQKYVFYLIIRQCCQSPLSPAQTPNLAQPQGCDALHQGTGTTKTRMKVPRAPVCY